MAPRLTDRCTCSDRTMHHYDRQRTFSEVLDLGAGLYESGLAVESTSSLVIHDDGHLDAGVAALCRPVNAGLAQQLCGDTPACLRLHPHAEQMGFAVIVGRRERRANPFLTVGSGEPPGLLALLGDLCSLLPDRRLQPGSVVISATKRARIGGQRAKPQITEPLPIRSDNWPYTDTHLRRTVVGKLQDQTR